MDHNKKIEKWLEFAEQNKLASSYRRPPVDYIVQKLGIKCSPLFFWSFTTTALVLGTMFAISWGLLMSIFFWKSEGQSLILNLIYSIFAGLLFGISMAFLHSKDKKKLNLSAWENFPPK